MRVTASLLAFAVGFAPAASRQADDTYDLTLDYTSKAGEVTNQTLRDNDEAGVTFYNGDSAIHKPIKGHAKSIAYTEEIVKVDGDDVIAEKATFREATHRVEAKDVDYAFKGKAVLAKKGDAGWALTYEDGAELAKEDLAEVTAVLGKKKRESGKPNGREMMSPGKPVKVGESWNLDPKPFAIAILNDSTSFDFAHSTGSMKLLSVQKRGTAQFAHIAGEIELIAEKMGPTSLTKPLPMRITLTMDACIDGKNPSLTMSMEATMKGRTTAKVKGDIVDLEIDYHRSVDRVIELVK